MEEEIPKTIEGFKDWTFSSGGTIGEDFKIFSKVFKKWLKEQAREINAELINYLRGHYYTSGFIKRDNKYVYFSISDVRYWRNWYNHILIRTANNEQDYTGGMNNEIILESFKKRVNHLLQ